VPRNATAEIIEGLRVAGAVLRPVVLPVVWWRAAALALDAARDFAPHVVLMNGVAQPRQALFCERGATERRAGAADVEGTVAGPFVGDGVAMMTLRLVSAARAARRTIALHAAVKRNGVRFDEVLTGAKVVRIRPDNAYLCNQVAFEVARARVAPVVGFLHWPSALEGAHIAAARAVLAAVIEAQLPRR
jgi:pyrrolidone-carboxylate peptidase